MPDPKLLLHKTRMPHMPDPTKGTPSIYLVPAPTVPRLHAKLLDGTSKQYGELKVGDRFTVHEHDGTLVPDPTPGVEWYRLEEPPELFDGNYWGITVTGWGKCDG